ncbi:MAG: hypothetical protein ACRDSJ_03405 [Rubrobacteraceae bacterium]
MGRGPLRNENPPALVERSVNYLYKLQSPRSRVGIALDWFLDLFLAPTVTRIRR